jgi:hypothetical protein
MLSTITVLAVLAVAGPASAAEGFQPGVTDFPNYGPIASPQAAAGDGFDWADAGLGTAAGVALGSLGVAALVVLRQRNEPATA